jgi:hypothetical protein
VTDNRQLNVDAVALHGLIEQLLINEPSPPDGATAPGSRTATTHDGLRAVAELARAIEVPAEAGDLDPEQAHRMASLLLVVRDALGERAESLVVSAWTPKACSGSRETCSCLDGWIRRRVC